MSLWPYRNYYDHLAPVYISFSTLLWFFRIGRDETGAQQSSDTSNRPLDHDLQCPDIFFTNVLHYLSSGSGVPHCLCFNVPTVELSRTRYRFYPRLDWIMKNCNCLFIRFGSLEGLVLILCMRDLLQSIIHSTSIFLLGPCCVCFLSELLVVIFFLFATYTLKFSQLKFLVC